MSDFDDNNPFADREQKGLLHESKPQPRRMNEVLDDYNPFNETGATSYQTFNEKQPQAKPNVQPVTEAPYQYQHASATSSSAAADDLLRRQAELDQREAELARKEQEMQRTMQGQIRQNNFPPLPAACCVQPCFYQDFNVDIPFEFKKVVKAGYYLWIAYSGLLVVNMFGALGYLIGSKQAGTDNLSGTTFGLSILYLLLFTPCSFVCWFRPLYKAFRSDSSFNFFFFFFIFFFQFCVTVLQAIGVDGWGFCGFLSGLGMITAGSISAVTAGIFMLLIAVSFAALAIVEMVLLLKGVSHLLDSCVYSGYLISFQSFAANNHIVGIILLIIGLMFSALAIAIMILLLRVHRIYRSSGASFAKAQEEFARGVWSNDTVRQTTANIASTAARSAAENAMSGNRQ